MKPFTSTIPIDSNQYVLLKRAEIVGAFINALPPRVGNLHGTSIEFFFQNGESCCIEGSITDVSPKEEAYSLRFGTAMPAEVWQKALLGGAGKPVIETIDLRALWSSQGLNLLLTGPREVQLFRKAGSDSRLMDGDPRDFQAVRLYVPGYDEQSVVLYASEDFPGDVVMTSAVPMPEIEAFVEVEVSPVTSL